MRSAPAASSKVAPKFKAEITPKPVSAVSEADKQLLAAAERGNMKGDDAALASGVSGVVLSDQIKSLDWRARRATKIATAPTTVLEQVVARVVALVAVV